MEIQVGDPFPQFQLLDQDGQTVTNETVKGARTLVYFYPKDDTSGCTAQACALQERLPNFEGVHVIGVSPDSVKSHRKFADKYGLSFTLLADTDHKLCDDAGVWVEKSMYGKKYMGVERTSFLLDASGQVTHVWRKVKPADHAADVLAALNNG